MGDGSLSYHLLLSCVVLISDSKIAEDEMIGDDEVMEVVLDRKLIQQISNAIEDRDVAAVGAVCGFLHVIFNTSPLEKIMTVLAYRTELVPILRNFMKRCHENKKWSSLSEYLSGDAPGWLLPLSVFCPVYKHMLTIVDNEEYYEQEKPLSLKDIRSLIILLRQALWQLLWVNHTTSANLVKSVPVSTAIKKQFEAIQQRVSIVVSQLLSQKPGELCNKVSLLFHAVIEITTRISPLKLDT
ncbi:hypothetical protein VNO80_01231 [Phaseolus coccineus]|uniref:HECT-type E3 ubiquitin transferase n=1 Tax=Phaseolus coccineus TaxID=3886 RepID=A0AAN9NZN5_PHACN